MSAESEISELDVAVHAEQDVVGLDVTVDNALGVQELQAVESLAADSRDLTLGHHVEGDNVSKTATLHVFHDYPEIATDKERVHEVDDVLVFAVPHNQNFVDNEILLRLLLQIHLLDGNALIGTNFKRCVDATRSTLANFDQAAELLGRVGRVANDIQLADDLGVGD